MPELIAPTRRLRTAWLEAHAEWGPGVHEDGFGLLQTDNVDSPAGFEAWVARLAEESGSCTYRWIIDDGHVTGGIALRHETHDLVARSGHIGFGIRMDRVLVMCEAGNVASAKTIESQGGAPADLVDLADNSVWRYWIRL